MSDTANKAERQGRDSGVRVVRGVRGLSPSPADELLVRLEEPVYQLPDGTLVQGAREDDEAYQVYPEGATVTAAQAREWGLGAEVNPERLEERREQFPDYVGGSAVVDRGSVSRVRVDGSTSGPLDDAMTVQTAEDVEQRVTDAIAERGGTRESRQERREAEQRQEQREADQQREAAAAGEQPATQTRRGRQQAADEGK